MLRRLLIMLLLALAPPAAAAEPFPVSAMMSETGLDRIMEAARSALTNAPEWMGNLDDAKLIAAWKAKAELLIDREAFNARLAAALSAETWSSAEQDVLGAFYRSELGLRETALDAASSEMSDEEAAAAYAEGQQIVRTLSPARRALVEDFVRLNAPLSSVFDRQFIRAGLAATAIAYRKDTSLAAVWPIIEDNVMRSYDERRASLDETALISWSSTYRGLSDAELQEIVDFLKTPAAQHFYASAGIAVGNGLGDLVTQIAEAVAAELHATNI